ncbi:hypothetical protein D1BOALGB6SA_9021 [Olavius sp. associated proteobacterium Delta 1]|nr:hypothetical protein D1BOALGB6SA_9021 [Olavius sp. associated proteobacterium Delta 1]
MIGKTKRLKDEVAILTLTLHKFLSSSQAVMSEIVAFSGQMLDA